MLKSLVQCAIGCATRRNYCTKPTIVPVLNKYLDQQNQLPRQVWIEGMETVDGEKKGIIELHPSIFAQTPRIDIMHRNVEWQAKYRWVRFSEVPNRAEMPGGGRKPWPQKGDHLFAVLSLLLTMNINYTFGAIVPKIIVMFQL